jgi:SAM-dependent methyltransferase
MTYAARTKYDDPGRAKRYAGRGEPRGREEWALVEEVAFRTPGVAPPRDVLDAPCGAGRIAAAFLARGVPVRCADLSPAMRAEAANSLGGAPGLLGVETIDLEAAPPPSAWAADLVVCFRFLHHLPDAATRGRVLASLAALSKRLVLVSFHHPVSAHHLARALRRLLTRRRGDRHAITARRLAREASAHGLRLLRTAAVARYRRDLWIALFLRADAARTDPPRLTPGPSSAPGGRAAPASSP